MSVDPATRELVGTLQAEARAALLRWLAVDAPPMRTEDGTRAMVNTNGRPIALDVIEALLYLADLEPSLRAADQADAIEPLSVGDLPHPTKDDLTGVGRIGVERARQKLEEGYTAEHDAGEGDALALAAAMYALPATSRTIVRGGAPLLWPWRPEFWKPTPADRIRELEKAGALVAAAIDALLAEGKVRNGDGG